MPAGDAREPVAETPDIGGAYPRLTDEQIATLETDGSRRSVRKGQTLVREGEPCDEFFVVLAGKVGIFEDAEERHLIRVHGPRRFLGELGLLEGQVAFFTAVVLEDGEVLVVPELRLRALVAHDPALGDLILRAYLVRRYLLIDQGSGFRIIGSSYSPDTLRLREFATRNRLPHRWIDVERDQHSEQMLRHLGITPQDTPVVIWQGERVIRNPTNAELARIVGLAVPETARELCDLVVVGAGPAGLAASVYGASDGLGTTVLESVAVGGQASTSSRVENYLGFPAGISGDDLAERAVIQADKFGARILLSAQGTTLDLQGGEHLVRLADGTSVLARAVILATGARYRELAVPGIEAFHSNGVYYAATHQEAQVCGPGPVGIVGGGNSAGQATVFLADRVSRVHLLIRGDDLGKSMSRYLVQRVERHPKVTVHRNTEVRDVQGESKLGLQMIVAEDNRTGEQMTLSIRALFVFIGAESNAAWLAGSIALDDHGFIRTGPDAVHPATKGDSPPPGRSPLLLETSRPGVFAAGDVRSGSVKRVASAVGEGAMAVRQVFEYFAGS